MHLLKAIKNQRGVGATDISYCSLHIFVDASQYAYSACVFLICESPNGAVNVQLLQTKSRITIPRLELMKITTGTRLLKFIIDILQIENVDAWI